MNRGDWQATAHRVADSQTALSANSSACDLHSGLLFELNLILGNLLRDPGEVTD